MKRGLYTYLLLALALPFCAEAQAPLWTHTLPKAENSTFVYVREQGIGTTQQEAVNIAMTRVFQTTANRIGQPFDSQNLSEALQRGTPLEVISQTYNIPVNKVCDYTEILSNGSYRVYVLCQVAVSGAVDVLYEPFVRCLDPGEGGGWTAVLKSAFVPGLGQMGKGRMGEGVATLVGEVALLGGAVGCYYMAQDKLNVMRDPQVSYSDFTDAQKNYNTLQKTSRILWGAAATLYAFNLIRAATMKPKYHDGVALAPSVMSAADGFAPSLILTFNF